MLIRKYLKRMLPDAKRLANDSSLSRISHYLLKPQLWHINRQSIARGTAIGVFMAFLPLPMQMLIAAMLAILFNANLPIAVALTWITNPITFLPINYFIYKVGRLFVQNGGGYHAIKDFEFTDRSLHDIAGQVVEWLHSVGKPFLVGLPVVAICSSIAGYCLVHFIWRLSFYCRIKNRKGDHDIG